MRSFLSWRRGDACLLAEANVLPDEVEEYVGVGDKLHMLFNFYVNQHLFLALATGRADDLTASMRRQHRLPVTAQWANFLRNHDELDLSALSTESRQRVYEAFAPDPGMQLYGRGIRRRLAPMLANERRRIELAYSILLVLPGTPVIRYGDEIGMGDDLSLPERFTVRTPMQWSDRRNGGFSTAPAAQLVRAVVETGEFGVDAVNVADQQRDPASLLNWLQRAIGIRRGCPELAWGDCAVLDGFAPAVLALRSDWKGHRLLSLHNLGAEPCHVGIDVAALRGDAGDEVAEIFTNRHYGRLDMARLELDPFGYRWFRATKSGDDAAPP
jgi:maltose alpha-D-glucosyltransferase/alpha-amylase